MTIRFAWLLLAVVVVACGGGSSSSMSPTAPTPTIPAVNGSYNGTVTVTYPELSRSVTCPASTVVTQSGSTVNIAPIVLGGGCGGFSIPVGQTTIDTTGAIPGEADTFNEPSCGTYSYTASGGFFGRDFRFSMNATSRTCYNFNATFLMAR